ncbi:MAG TPA: hypothetical protein VEA39_04165, partial [Methylophilaceae bacterium]|nr:hypothetical protein [Methylophilaceae bacterium]
MTAARESLIEALGLTLAEARVEGNVLMCFAMGVDRAWLLAHENEPMEAEAYANFHAHLLRRLGGEPMAYIIGRREFYGL